MMQVITIIRLVMMIAMIMISSGNCKCCYQDKSGSTSRTRTSPFEPSPPCPPRCCCRLMSRLKSAVNAIRSSVFEQHQNECTADISLHIFLLFDLDFDQFLQYLYRGFRSRIYSAQEEVQKAQHSES